MAEVERELQRLDAIRRRHEARLERHWEALQDHDVRGRLMKDAAHDMLRSWKPAQVLGSLFGSGSFGSSLGFALGRRGGWAKRAFLFALSMAAPSLLKRVSGLSLKDISEEVELSIGRIKDYLRSRKEAHTTEPEG